MCWGSNGPKWSFRSSCGWHSLSWPHMLTFNLIGLCLVLPIILVLIPLDKHTKRRLLLIPSATMLIKSSASVEMMAGCDYTQKGYNVTWSLVWILWLTSLDPCSNRRTKEKNCTSGHWCQFLYHKHHKDFLEDTNVYQAQVPFSFGRMERQATDW